ncbi:hypothetical protein BpHYR1_037405 [Brachionus plicatilis]|uniref:Uncharacterized protein n=1 Tax=Brachionus plicatilis TaxID=10195 RepID=A0A3M7SQ33_BRAPC|nr:hypothetical protein BpHYR1_037405 [Brachionus plicatilis]
MINSKYHFNSKNTELVKFTYFRELSSHMSIYSQFYCGYSRLHQSSLFSRSNNGFFFDATILTILSYPNEIGNFVSVTEISENGTDILCDLDENGNTIYSKVTSLDAFSFADEYQFLSTSFFKNSTHEQLQIIKWQIERKNKFFPKQLLDMSCQWKNKIISV